MQNVSLKGLKMFERNYRIESMERDKDTGFFVASISYNDGIFGLTKKYNKAILINNYWVDAVTMKDISKYHIIIEMLENMRICKMKTEQNNVEA